MKIEKFLKQAVIYRQLLKEAVDIASLRGGLDGIIIAYLGINGETQQAVMRNDLLGDAGAAATSVSLKRLLEKNLIIRRDSEEDRRVNFLRLTEKGMVLFRDIERLIDRA